LAKYKTTIPVNVMTDHFDGGIAFERLSMNTLEEVALNAPDEAKQPHREDRHSFFLLEKGTVVVEIDFQTFEIRSPSVVYMHPDQVHRILRLENVTIGAWAMSNENLHPEYLKLLENLTPAKPLMLEQETFALLSDMLSLCIKFSQRKNGQLYHALLRDSCNALIALVASQYLVSAKPTDKLSRFKLVADAFRSALETHFISVKSPGAYAEMLNISTAYLNECLKNATGNSVSYHIQQRTILEAKRLLYHSDKSIKEIASELGYDDYPYFSKLFTKATAITPRSFRSKNRE
jgi:AraC family transcriptional activator of pobA